MSHAAPQRPGAASPIGAAGRIAFQILGITALGLLLSELALRVLEPHVRTLRLLLHLPTLRTGYDDAHDVGALMQQSLVGWRPLEPYGGFVLNSRGLMTHEYDAAKPPDTFRVVILGDSFAYGSGGVPFPDLWHTRLGRELDRAGDRGRVEVVNLGVDAVGPRFELRMWEVEGARLEADLVIMGLFVGNDFSDEQRPLELGPEERLARTSLLWRAVRNLRRLRGASRAPEPEAAEAGRLARAEATRGSPIDTTPRFPASPRSSSSTARAPA